MLRTHALASKYRITAVLSESIKVITEGKVNRGPRDQKGEAQLKKSVRSVEAKVSIPTTVRCCN